MLGAQIVEKARRSRLEKPNGAVLPFFGPIRDKLRLGSMRLTFVSVDGVRLTLRSRLERDREDAEKRF
jgi:hypothetical protein